ncbi:hypothetical protein RJZ57_003031 [Blastomyces gilchristii]
MATPPIGYIDKARREEFLTWLNKASFVQRYDNIYHCDDTGLANHVRYLLENVYEEGYKFSAWRARALCHFTSAHGFGELIVLSGTPRVGSGPVLELGSINSITNDDAVSPPIECVYVENARRKKLVKAIQADGKS